MINKEDSVQYVFIFLQTQYYSTQSVFADSWGSSMILPGSVRSVTETLVAFPCVDMCTDDTGVAGEAALLSECESGSHPTLGWTLCSS